MHERAQSAPVDPHRAPRAPQSTPTGPHEAPKRSRPLKFSGRDNPVHNNLVDGPTVILWACQI